MDDLIINATVIKIFFIILIILVTFFFYNYGSHKKITIHHNCQQSFLFLSIICVSIIFQIYAFQKGEHFFIVNYILCLIVGFSYGKLLYSIKNILYFNSINSKQTFLVSTNSLFYFSFFVFILTLVFFIFQFPYKELALIFALSMVLGISCILFKMFPEILTKSIIYWGLKFIFRVRLKGVENYPTKKERFLIIVNHISFLDFLLLISFLPDNLSFVAHGYYTRQRWIKLFLPFTNIYTIDSSHSSLGVIKSVIKDVNDKYSRCVIFPEGRISTTGTLMKIYEGPGLIADKANVPVLPIGIEGPQYTFFTKKNNQTPRRLFPIISISIHQKIYLYCKEEIQGRERRKILSYQIADILSDLMLTARHHRENIFLALLDAKKKFGRNKVILSSVNSQKVTYRQLITKSFVLGQYVKSCSSANEYVGILLPNSIPAIILIFSLYIHGRIPAILNFTLGQNTLVDSLNLANIHTIFTSRQFIQKANLLNIINKLALTHHVVYLEEVRDKITVKDKLIGFFSGMFPYYFYRCYRPATSEGIATLLFTSGTESLPKAVLLSHINIQTNCYQLCTKFDFNYHDIAFNALPLFHSFGFLGAMMPLMLGINTFCYPSPLHYRIIPELCYELGATIIYATDTFLKGYAMRAHPFDFHKIRYVFTGAEKLKVETQALWFEKFGIRILEGYGITETGPVIASNTLMHYKQGTVGRFLPMIQHRIEKVEGLEGENIGRLFVKGPNVMLGYLTYQKASKKILTPENGWHDTGDIVHIDLFGFVTILGRAKRFAKIAGEMISLSAIEDHATSINHKYSHVAICLQKVKQGDVIVLLTECYDLIKKDLINYFKLNQISMLLLPKFIFYIKTLPKTATGKTDYLAATQLARNMMASVITEETWLEEGDN